MYTRDELQRAALESIDLEIEHGSDLEQILKRGGVDVEDLAAVTAAMAQMTVAHRLENDPALSDHDIALTYGATLAAFVRGFAAALQLRRTDVLSSAQHDTPLLRLTRRPSFVRRQIRLRGSRYSASG